MKPQSSLRPNWHHHVNAVNPPSTLRSWLTRSGSLSARLSMHSQRFEVHLLTQQPAASLPDEYQSLGLRRRGRVQMREVLLRCDGRPVVFAHTVTPLRPEAANWPGFRSLGKTPLGEKLFGDPRVVRGPLQFARLPRRHPLARRVQAICPNGLSQYLLYSRRSLFRRQNARLLVTEVFLPDITTLSTVVDQ